MNRQALHLLTFEPRVLIAKWLQEYEYTGSPNTLRNYRDLAQRVLLPFLGDINNVNDITPDTMRGYMKAQADWRYTRSGVTRPLSASEIQKRWQTAFRFLGWCEEQGYIGAHPMQKLRRPKMPTAGRFAMSRDEVQRLWIVLNAKPGVWGVRDRAIVTVLLGTGARAMELVNMTLADVDWPRHKILLHGKGDKDRRAVMGKAVTASLREWLRVRPRIDSNALWVGQRKNPMTYGALEMMTRHLGQLADVDPCNVHRFRHTFATEHYRANKNLLAVKNALGHTKVDVTMRYLNALGVNYEEDRVWANPADWLTK